MEKNIIIKNESDAYAILQDIVQDKFDPSTTKVEFDGWPKLHIHLTGKNYEQTITPTMMKSFLELQKGVYRAYCLAKYNSPNVQHLTKDERADLEIKVKVSDGSSNFEIDTQALLIKFIELVGDKMEPVHIVTMAVSLGAMYFGSSSLKTYLDNRKAIREKEITAEEQRAQIEVLKFSSAEETKRAEIMASIIKKQPVIKNVELDAHDIQTSMVKSFSSADEAEYQGVTITPEVASELTTNARRKSEEVRLDGNFRIRKVDSSDPTLFRVTIEDTTTKNQIDATVQDSSLTTENKQILQDAEWSRKTVKLEINAKELREQIQNAIIIKVTKVE